MEQELCNANAAFQEERTARMNEMAAARQTIGELRHDLHDANTRILQQGTVVEGVADLGEELREARQKIEIQSAEMKQLENVADDMIDQVGDLTDAFHQIDAERGQRHVVNPNTVKSAPVHVQGAPTHVTEPAEHVQTVPSSSVINLVNEESGGRKTETVQEYVQRKVEERMQQVREEIRRGKQPANVPISDGVESSSMPGTSNGASTSGGHHSLHEHQHATPSSQFVAKTGSFVPLSAPLQGNAGVSDVNRPPTVENVLQESARSRVIVDRTPRLPSGT